MAKVLIIDDNIALCSALTLLLSLHDIETLSAYTPQAGVDIINHDEDVAVVIQDMNFSEDTSSGKEGVALFETLRHLRPDLPIILLTAWTQLETAVALVRQGAADYLSKPWDDAKLVTSVSNLLALAASQDKVREQEVARRLARQALSDKADLCGIVYQSPGIQSLLETAIKVAPADVPILIVGPNGSGKEKIAEIIQANSRVCQGPFVKVNIGALPNDLMEAELFGAEAGAYTGANKRRIGRFEAADGGTLFLDELGNLSPNGQTKLLRILQTGEYERLGSSATLRCKVRVISATNADLNAQIRAGSFREDLYYRLNVIELDVPALRDRREDILPLVHYFLGNAQSISPKLAALLRRYDWPGNVRQLENACKRAQLLGQNTDLELSHFGIEIDPATSASASPIIEPSQALIESALSENDGVVAQAARQLGLTRQALYRRLKKYGIENV